MPPPSTYCCLIVMGVSGSGKSSLGTWLAQAWGLPFIDGDDLHPQSNLQKMADGRPLDDADRAPWLQRIADRIDLWEQEQQTGIIACSALKRKYRDQIRGGKQNRLFLFLDGAYEQILQRLQRRQGHFMGSEMLHSQFEALESPVNEPDVIRLPLEGSLEALGQCALRSLAAVHFPKS